MSTLINRFQMINKNMYIIMLALCLLTYALQSIAVYDEFQQHFSVKLLRFFLLCD